MKNNGKPRIFKTATLQTRNNGNISNKGAKRTKIIGNKYTIFWSIIPNKIVKTHGWKKGEKLMFIPLDDVIEAKPGDVIIRRC